MTAPVILLESQRRKRARTAAEQSDACRCRRGYVCYAHRIAEAVFQLRNELAATEGQLLVDRDRLVRIAESVLPPLEAIVAETLPREAAQ